MVTGSGVGESRVESRARWNSAPFVLERVDSRSDATRVEPKHPKHLMGLVASDQSCKLVIDLEIRRRSTVPKVGAFVRRAELAYPMELRSDFRRTSQQGTMA